LDDWQRCVDHARLEWDEQSGAWKRCDDNVRRQKWLKDVALQADPEQNVWRERVRDEQTWNNAAAMKEMGQTALEKKAAASALVTLGCRLIVLSVDDGLALLKRAVREHPDDFWTNVAVGDALVNQKNFAESARYYQAALAIRPNSSVAYNNLGANLAHSGHNDEALEYFREAARIDPNSVTCQRKSAMC